MEYKDQIIRDYSGQAFQAAFRAYFDEMGGQVSNWDGLFAQMTDEGEPTVIRMDENGRVIGFIQFCRIEMTCWFFEDRCGFIREFWIAPEHRGRGHGTALLAQAEGWFRRQGIARMLLTTDTAEGFYMLHGYHRDESMVAKNRSPVYVKVIGS